MGKTVQQQMHEANNKFTNLSIMKNSDKEVNSPEWIEERNQRIELAYALASPEEKAAWKAESNKIRTLFGVETTTAGDGIVGQKGGQFYTDTYTPDDFVAQKGAADQAMTLKFNQEKLDEINTANNTSYTEDDIRAMQAREGELRYLINGAEKAGFASKYGLPIVLGAMAVASGGMLASLSATASPAASVASMSSADLAATTTAGKAIAAAPELATALSSGVGTAGSTGGISGAISAAKAFAGTYGTAIKTAATIGTTYLQGQDEKAKAKQAATADIEAREQAVGELTTSKEAAAAERTAARDLAIAEENLIITGTGQEKVDQLRKVLNTAKRASIEASNAARDKSIAYQEGQAGKAKDVLGTTFEGAQETQRPWYDAGKKALGVLEGATLEGDTSKFFTDPSYEFTKGEALRAVDRTAAAKGGALSGAAVAASQDRAAGLASQEYGNWYGRVSDLSETGRVTGTNMANQEIGYGRDVADVETGLGKDVSKSITDAGRYEADARMNVGELLANQQQDLDQQANDARERKAGYFMNTGQDVADDEMGYGQNVADARIGQGDALSGYYQTKGQVNKGVISDVAGAVGSYFMPSTTKKNTAITELE